MRLTLAATAALFVAVAGLAQLPPAGPLPVAESAGALELVGSFTGPMPTGVTVSHAGRVFVNFPRWGDPVDATVVELHGGQAVPFPDADANHFDREHVADRLVSVQSVVV